MITYEEIIKGAQRKSAGDFRNKSYLRSDKLGKDRFSTYITKKGHIIIKDDEDFNHDLISKKDDELHYWELEMKTGYTWKGRKSYPFDTVHFLARKERLAEVHPFYYVIMCTESDWAIGCKSSVIFYEGTKKEIYINTSERKGTDWVYDVSIDLCDFFKVNRLKDISPIDY